MGGQELSKRMREPVSDNVLIKTLLEYYIKIGQNRPFDKILFQFPDDQDGTKSVVERYRKNLANAGEKKLFAELLKLGDSAENPVNFLTGTDWYEAVAMLYSLVKYKKQSQPLHFMFNYQNFIYNPSNSTIESINIEESAGQETLACANEYLSRIVNIDSQNKNPVPA